jgi:hypothetical protein
MPLGIVCVVCRVCRCVRAHVRGDGSLMAGSCGLQRRSERGPTL